MYISYVVVNRLNIALKVTSLEVNTEQMKCFGLAAETVLEGYLII